MIEAGIVPALWVMAIGTGLAQFSIMGIVLLVAVDAFVGRFPVLFVCGMTLQTAAALVGTFEAEIRQAVVKYLRVQWHDIGITTLVFGVAAFAFLSGNAGIAAVISLFFL